MKTRRFSICAAKRVTVISDECPIIICLIVAKHHLSKDVIVRSDGSLDIWQDGMLICQKILGYGLEFTLQE